MLNKFAPIIMTERLILREHRLEDFPDCAKLWADDRVTRYIGGRVFSEEATWTKFLRCVGHWSLMGFGYWLVREKNTQKLVGEVGFVDYKRNIVPAYTDTPEAVWALNPAFQGQGYAVEAAMAVLNWGDQHLPRERTVCLIALDNEASIRLAQKLGYREFDRANYHGDAVILFERLNAQKRDK